MVGKHFASKVFLDRIDIHLEVDNVKFTDLTNQTEEESSESIKMVGKHFASKVFPEPGGPIIKTLCPPAAAISNARLALD